MLLKLQPSNGKPLKWQRRQLQHPLSTRMGGVEWPLQVMSLQGTERLTICMESLRDRFASDKQVRSAINSQRAKRDIIGLCFVYGHVVREVTAGQVMRVIVVIPQCNRIVKPKPIARIGSIKKVKRCVIQLKSIET